MSLFGPLVRSVFLASCVWAYFRRSLVCTGRRVSWRCNVWATKISRRLAETASQHRFFWPSTIHRYKSYWCM